MLGRRETGGETGATRFRSRGVRASLRLGFDFETKRGLTVLTSSHQEPPLRVVRAFALEDGTALAHIHNVSGGLLGGDELAMQVRVGPAASVQLTSTGATRIYRARDAASVTRQSNDITVEEGGLLEYVPDALIPFSGARFCQRTVIRLASGAGLFWWEILAPGREARGEVFQYECVEMKTDVMALGRSIAAERIRLEPGECDLASPARFGRHRYWATFYVCRVGLDPSTWLSAEEQLRKVAQRLSRPDQTLWSISTLVRHGLIIRCLTSQGRELLPGLRVFWRAAKLLLYGREAVPPRKVN